MQRLSYADVIARIRSDLSKYTYVARLNTPWTFLGLQVWLRMQHKTLGFVPRGAVIFMPSAIGHELQVAEPTIHALESMGADLFLSEPFTVETHRTAQRKRAITAPFWSIQPMLRGKTLHIVAGRHRDFALAMDIGVTKRTLSFVVLDEGYGAFPVHGPRLTWRYRAEVALRTLVARMPTEMLFLSERSGESFVVNENLRREYRDLVVMQQPNMDLVARSPRVALLCTSYNFESGHAPLSQILEDTGRIVTALDHAGYEIWLKQHPRELGNKYQNVPAIRDARNLRYLPSNIAGEAFLPLLRPKQDLVIGLLSNLHYTAQVLFDLEVMYLPSKTFGVAAFADQEPLYAPIFPKGLRGYSGDFSEMHGLEA